MKTTWDLHNDHEQVLVDRTVMEVGPKWRSRLRGVDTYLRDKLLGDAGNLRGPRQAPF